MLKFLQFTLMRAVMSILTLLLVSLIVFSLMELVPGNCAERYIAFKNTQGQNDHNRRHPVRKKDASASTSPIRGSCRKRGLGNVFFKGEFGDSCILRLNINHLLSDKVWISLGICLAALLLSYLDRHPDWYLLCGYNQKSGGQ